MFQYSSLLQVSYSMTTHLYRNTFLLYFPLLGLIVVYSISSFALVLTFLLLIMSIFPFCLSVYKFQCKTLIIQYT